MPVIGINKTCIYSQFALFESLGAYSSLSLSNRDFIVEMEIITETVDSRSIHILTNYTKQMFQVDF